MKSRGNNFYIQRLFMLCICIEIQACENERISGFLKILNIIIRKKKVSFLLTDTKKSFKKLYFCNKNLEKNDPHELFQFVLRF